MEEKNTLHSNSLRDGVQAAASRGRAREGQNETDPVQCCSCGRFVSVETAGRHIDGGDYGTVYSVEFECPRGKGCNA